MDDYAESERARLAREREKLLAKSDLALHELNTAKERLAAMRSAAFTHGRYAAKRDYDAAMHRVVRAQEAHQRLLRAVSAVAKALKRANIAQAESFETHFINAARDLLTPELFQHLWREASLRSDDLHTRPATLSGAAVPTHGAIASPRLRPGERPHVPNDEGA